MASIRLQNITKTFGNFTAVSDLNLDVANGEFFVLLGPTGAGKTTTLRMIVGLIRPSAGAVLIAGDRLTLWHRAPLARLGAIVEAPSLYTYLSGRDNLRMLADLGGGCPARRIDEVLDRVGLTRRARDKVAVYSHGMKQRLAIAAALLPGPALLLLDEPTNGLDPMGIRDTRHLIRSLARDDGLTIFLSSHLLAEVEQICNRGTVLVEGRKLWEGEIPELLVHGRRIRLRAEPLDTVRAVLAELGAEVTAAADPAVLHVRGHVRGVAGGVALGPETVVERLVHAGCRVSEVVAETPPLEEAFLALIAGKEAA